MFVFAYQLFYGLSINLIIHDPHGKNSAGLFVQDHINRLFTNMDLFYTFIGFIGIFLAIPTINYVLIKKIEKRNPIVSTQ